jgi:hypothetical protein
MHGRKRPEIGSEAATAEEAAKIAKKIAAYRVVCNTAFGHVSMLENRAVKCFICRFLGFNSVSLQRDTKDASAAAFTLNGQLLGMNPDVATLWNYRRTVLLGKLEHAYVNCAFWPALSPLFHCSPPEEVASAVAVELQVAAAGIQRNPKSYPAWHHRCDLFRRSCNLNPVLLQTLDCGAVRGACKRG